MGVILHSVYLLSIVASSMAAHRILCGLKKRIKNEIQSIKYPIGETITSVGSSQCSNVKKIIGVAYNQIDGGYEPDLNKLTLELRTNDFRTIYTISAAARALPRSSGIDLKQKLVIFLHGFTDDPTKNSFKIISDSFLEQGKCNILALDASSLIRWFYFRSTTYVRFIGEKLGAVLAAMVDNGVDPAQINMIGHSLGSHISGFTGKTFHNLTSMKIGRISSLDPAGPCFSHIDPDLRLKYTDADFVDVMHTNAGIYGLRDPIGHVDFYPNSGSKQPNCLFQICSHSRTWLYYAESVTNPKAFPALKCEDWDAFKAGKCSDEVQYMGYRTPSNSRGLFYLRTNDEYPFGLGDNGIKYEGDTGVVNRVVVGGQQIVNAIDMLGAMLLG